MLVHHTVFLDRCSVRLDRAKAFPSGGENANPYCRYEGFLSRFLTVCVHGWWAVRASKVGRKAMDVRLSMFAAEGHRRMIELVKR